MNLKDLTRIRKKAFFKLIRNILFFNLLIVLTFWFIFKDQDMNELFRIIKSAKTQYVLIGIGVMLIYYLMESINIRHILRSLGDNISLFRAYKYTLIGFFFSAITPAATGGQPVEMYYMTKDGVKGSNATLVLLIQLCGFQISTISLGIICAIINPAVLSDGLMWLFLLGLGINGFALAVMLICIFSKRLTRKIVDFMIACLKFFKAKDLDKRIKRINDGLENYNVSSKYILANKGKFFRAILRVFIQIIFYYTVPYCVYRSFGFNSYNLFQVFVMQAILYNTVSGIPLPGAIGISESVFLKIYGPLFGEALSAAMLLTRGINFYFFVILSAVIVVLNAVIKKNVKGEIDQRFLDDLDENQKVNNE